jgi:phage gp36-like protein
MAYITLDDLVARYGEREMLDTADRDGDGTPDPVVLDAAIGDAGRDVDGQIGGRYHVPLADPPELVRRLACQLARYYLHFQPPEHVRAGYKDALAQLADIRDGRVAIDAPPASGGGSVSGHPRGRAMPPVFAAGRIGGP